jgi:hypothetical protein
MSTLRHSMTLRSAIGLQSERLRSRQAMIAWRQSAGSSAGGQGRKPAEPGARSASLDGLTPGRHRSPKRSRPSLRCWAESRPQGAPAVARRFDSQQLFARRASRAPRGLAPHLFKINVQTSTYGPNRPQRHRRFYLAIKLDRLAEPMPDTSQARRGSRCARPAPPRLAALTGQRRSGCWLPSANGFASRRPRQPAEAATP